MFFRPEQDFVCKPTQGFALCFAKSPAVQGLFAQLHRLVEQSLVLMAAARQMPPPVALPPTFGTMLASGLQTVLTTLNKVSPLPSVLYPVLSLQSTDEEIVERMAERVALLIDYIQKTQTLFPHALTQPPAGTAAPLQAAPKLPLGKMIAAGAGALVVTSGIIALAHHRQKRQAGTIDMAHRLGEDDFDEGEDGEADDGAEETSEEE